MKKMKKFTTENTEETRSFCSRAKIKKPDIDLIQLKFYLFFFSVQLRASSVSNSVVNNFTTNVPCPGCRGMPGVFHHRAGGSGFLFRASW